MIKILVFEIGLLIGLILEPCLSNLITKIKKNLYWKKEYKRGLKYLKYCEENNVCPPGVCLDAWQLEKKLQKESMGE